MTQIKNIFSSLALLAGCIILTTGCEKEKYETRAVPLRSNRPIWVKVATTGVTRSAEMKTADLEISEGFVLDAYTNDTWYDLYDDPGDPSTFGLPKESTKTLKGKYIDSDGKVNVKYSSGHISDTPGYGHDGDETDYWYLVDGSGNVETYNWITGGDEGGKKFYLRFWARYPKDADVDDPSEGVREITVEPDPDGTTETFTYALPTSSAGSDATNQKDILFAYNAVHKTHIAPASSAPYYSSFPVALPDDNVDLTFNHPLSMIRFCVSPDDATFDVKLKIKRITIENVPSSGTCVFDGEATDIDDDMFVWTPSTGTGSYSQDYNAMFDVAPTGWTGASYGGLGKHIYTCENAFMLIPHNTSSYGAKLTITFVDTDYGTEIDRWVLLNDTWKPGYYYTYKIKATKIGRSVSSSVYLLDWNNRYSTMPIM